MICKANNCRATEELFLSGFGALMLFFFFGAPWLSEEPHLGPGPHIHGDGP